MSLPYDICRCQGGDCNIKSSCKRYLDTGAGFRTPFVHTMRDDKHAPCKFYIPAEIITYK